MFKPLCPYPCSAISRHENGNGCSRSPRKALYQVPRDGAAGYTQNAPIGVRSYSWHTLSDEDLYRPCGNPGSIVRRGRPLSHGGRVGAAGRGTTVIVTSPLLQCVAT